MSSYYDHTAEPVPWNVFGYVSVAYHFSPRFRVVYHQKMTGDFYSDHSGESYFRAMDPRLALRYERDAPFHWSLDGYGQPGIFGTSRELSRIGDIGLRLSADHATGILSGGGFVDTWWSFYERSSAGSEFSGMSSVWVGFNVAPRLTTQHAVFIAWKKDQEKGLHGIEWDSPYRPIAQNDLNVDITDEIWLALLWNHSLINPVFNRVWLSMWFGSVFR